VIDEHNYEDFPELYAQAMLTNNKETALAQYWEQLQEENHLDELTDTEIEYENPLDLLEQEEAKKVIEIAEAQRILNGETGSLAGMNYHHTDAISD